MMYYVIKTLDSEEASLVEWPKNNNFKPRHEDIIFESGKKDVAEAFLSGFKTLNNNISSPIKTSFVALYNDCFYSFVFSKGEWIFFSFGKSEKIEPEDKKVEYLKSVTPVYDGPCYGAYMTLGGLQIDLLPHYEDTVLYGSNNINDVVAFCQAYFEKYFSKKTKAWSSPSENDVIEYHSPTTLAKWIFKLDGYWDCFCRPVDINPDEHYQRIVEVENKKQGDLKIEDIKNILDIKFINHETKLNIIKSIVNFN